MDGPLENTMLKKKRTKPDEACLLAHVVDPKSILVKVDLGLGHI